MTKNSPYFLESMNAMQIRKKVDENTVAVLIFGACENHGDHMPFNIIHFSSRDCRKRLTKMAEIFIVLPAVPYEVSLHHNGFQMTFSLQSDTLVKIITDIFNSLISNKIIRILIINGHDGNIGPIKDAARSIKDLYPEVTICCLESWWTLVGQIRKDLFDIWNGLGHGGEARHPQCLQYHPDLVDI